MKNKKINFDQSTIRILYYKYKEFIIPMFIILVCVTLFLKVTIPQIEDISHIKDEEKTIKDSINILKKDLIFLGTLNSENLDSELDIASTALPPGKDFIGIISSISKSAINSGVKLDDFRFSVGELSTASAKVNTQPSLQINLAIKGNINGVKDFVEELAKSFPLSEITSLKIGDSSTTLVTVFYYKPFPPIELNDRAPQRALNKKELDMINKILSWQNEEESTASPSSNF